MYDDDSPNGNPFEASSALPHDAASPLRRSTVALRSLLASEIFSPSFSLSDLGDLTPHGGKATLSSVARCSGDPVPDQNEIGKWSRSAAQTQSDPHLHTFADPLGQFPITAVYTHAALGDGGSVCKIMERQVSRIRARVAAVGPDALPPLGGFGYYERHA